MLRQLRADTHHELLPLVAQRARVEQDLGEAVEHLLLVVDVAVEDVVHALREEGELVVKPPLAEAHLERRPEVAQLGREGRRLSNEGGVVEHEVAEALARVDGDVAGALSEGDHARLRDGQHEEHLHDLDLGVGLALGQVGAVVDDVARELAGVRRDEHARVLLLLEHHDLAVERQADAVSGLEIVVELVRLAGEGADVAAAGHLDEHGRARESRGEQGRAGEKPLTP